MYRPEICLQLFVYNPVIALLFCKPISGLDTIWLKPIYLSIQLPPHKWERQLIHEYDIILFT